MTDKACLFDTHAHVLSADVARYPYSTLRGGARPPVSAMVFPVEELLRCLDASGVDFACVVQRATLYGYDNRYALDAAASCPDRLVPVVVLDAEDPASPPRLRELAKAHRLGGLRIVAPRLSEADTQWLAGEQALALWRMAAELALPVTVILYRLNNAAGREALLRVAQQFRCLPILVDHVGLPHASTPEKRLAASQGIEYTIPPPPDFGIGACLAAFTELGHVHFKVTDINYDRLEEAHFSSAQFVRALVSRFGAERVLWGSDAGQSPAPYAGKVARLRASATTLDDREARLLSGATAYRLYGSRLG